MGVRDAMFGKFKLLKEKKKSVQSAANIKGRHLRAGCSALTAVGVDCAMSGGLNVGLTRR
jgi:hypothetical protein